MHNYLDDPLIPKADPSSAAEAMGLNFRTLRRAVEESPGSFGIKLNPRCKALVFTKLDEALMWMLKGIGEAED